MALPFCFAVGGAVLAARARVRGRTKVQTTTRNTSSYWRGLVHSLLSADDNNGRSVQQEERPFRVLLCATGSVATVKVPELALAFASRGAEVIVVLSSAARHMLYSVAPTYDPAQWEAFNKALNAAGAPKAAVAETAGNKILAVLEDKDEWSGYSDVRRDTVLHIDLRKWADACVVAPCSANTLAKAAAGLSDNLVSCVLRAWDFSKPIVVAPAMNTHMWAHPITDQNLAQLRTWGYAVVDPASKVLACGDVGRGALAPVPNIVEAVENLAKEE